MHLRRPWIALGLLASFAGHAAVVYKWTDADGVIHFSDQPVPGAVKIITSTGTASGGGNSAGRQAASTQGQGAPAEALIGVNYRVFAIESPAQDQTFFGDEIVGVRLHLEPPLQPNQSITWRLNGKQLDQGPEAVAFTLQSLARGVYSIAATVTDLATGETRSTDSVSFNVRQPSLLSPLHKKP